MKSILGALAAGVAGNALFAVVNSLVPFVDGPAWWASMVGVFVLFAALAYVLLSGEDGEKASGRASVGSGLESEDRLDVELGAVSVKGKADVSVLSGSKSKGPMKLSAGDIDLS